MSVAAASEPAVKAGSGAPSIGVGTLLRVLWRSFFFLAATNYERMQNVGFAYAMLPALRKLYRGKALDEAVERHLAFFNSHPYMAGALLGAAVSIEQDVAAGRRQPMEVEAFKRCMMGPFAAVGDSFFWASLRPFGAAWAVAGVLSGVLWAPLAFLLLYNLFHLAARGYGLFAGYRSAEAIITRLERVELVRLADRLHIATGVFIGAAGALFADRAMRSPMGLGDGLEPFLLAVLSVIFLLCLKRKMAMPVLLYGFAGGCIALMMGLNALFPLID